MKDEADVGLVDPHAEGDGRADDAIVLALKGVLIAGANLMIEPGVIGERAPAGAREFGRELLRPAPRRAIDDARFAPVRVEPVEELAGGVRFRPHGQKQVRAIERAHENPGTADEQLLGDFRPRRLVRGRGHRDHLDARKRFRDLAQAQIFGAEIVAPLRDAMRFVDGEKIDLGLPQGGDRVVAHEPFGRDIEKPERSLVEAARDPPAFVGIGRRN